MFSLGKCVRTGAKTIVVDRKNQKALALLCLASGMPPNAANSSDVYFDVLTEFAGGDRHSVPYLVPTMSVLHINRSCFFYRYITRYKLHAVTVHIFWFTKCFCFAAENKNTDRSDFHTKCNKKLN